MEHVIAFEQPDLLLVPLHVELHLAEVTAVLRYADSLWGQLMQSAWLNAAVMRKESIGCEQDLLRVTLLPHFVFERLLELYVLHVVSLLL